MTNSPYLEVVSVDTDTGSRLFAGGSPGEIFPHWQARKGVTGGQGNRNGTSSQTIADFFHENKWVSIVYSTFCILVPRQLPCFPGDKAILSKYHTIYFCLSTDVRCNSPWRCTRHSIDSRCTYHNWLSLLETPEIQLVRSYHRVCVLPHREYR